MERADKKKCSDDLSKEPSTEPHNRLSRALGSTRRGLFKSQHIPSPMLPCGAHTGNATGAPHWPHRITCQMRPRGAVPIPNILTPYTPHGDKMGRILSTTANWAPPHIAIWGPCRKRNSGIALNPRDNAIWGPGEAHNFSSFWPISNTRGRDGLHPYCQQGATEHSHISPMREMQQRHRIDPPMLYDTFWAK